jgi:uncharacterized protein YcbK (DUF882 family)
MDGLTILALGALVCGWAVSIAHTQERRAPQDPPHPVQKVTKAVDAALTDSRAPATAYVDDAALEFLAPLRGSSGKLRAAIRTPGAGLGARPDPNVNATIGEDDAVPPANLTAPADPGVYKLAVALGNARRQVDDLSVITLVPFAQKKGERVGLYYLGKWPYESGGTPRSAAYANPAGFIEVTQANKNTQVSEHFKLADFLTKDQYDVWPKYLVLQPKLVDKLELVWTELEREGHTVKHIQVMSGFRTPHYNVAGGNTGGRASLSRHMYGDASDIFVDNDGNGTMDDLNGDGHVDTDDADVVGRAADTVEQRYPALVGGVGVYKACCGHGPFTHIDTRGYRARWRGEGSG